ncbi:uncharacterized protein DSM5745_00820 [Aspergillus mulundensis]|uniref:Uncharacterized protein n=1 Tax=Aspergillus mulundensis TaxID=1810919 RepID=A0A3D8T660_9EURO|nr:hypothetical protein DSM5745_00820 [Aspergillus mulundensis]RDW93498.1 hypothetical protein DSM5745_00820 [Aspergillus mulundensis]
MYDSFEKNRGTGFQGPGYGYGYSYPQHPNPQPQAPLPQHGPSYGYTTGPPAQSTTGPGYGYGFDYNAPPPSYENHNGYGYGPSNGNAHGEIPVPGHQNRYPNEKPHNQYSRTGYSHYQGNVPAPAPHHITSSGLTPSLHRGPQSLVLRQSPSTHKVIFIHPAGAPINSPPLYSLTSSPKTSKADYVLARGADPNNPVALVGEVKSHTFSSKYDLTVRGTTYVLKESPMGSSFKIELPGRGVFKWYTDEDHLTSKMWLKDESKNVLATYDKSREKSSVGTWKKFVGGKDRELQLHGGFDDFFVEVLLVSIYAVKMANEGAIETAVEVASAVAGA